jgi:ParB-like chromosome segregation protein Spo0J
MEIKKPQPKIEEIKVDDLIPYATNSRTHSAEQVAQIAASMVEFGWTNPVLIDTRGTIVAGHGRVMAARKLGMETVPCIRLGHLSPGQVRAYVIADNKLAMNAGWDEEMLKAELNILKEEGFDIGLTGFTEDEMSRLFNEVVEPDQPSDFNEVGEDIKTDFRCPKCSYEWSGKPKA